MTFVCKGLCIRYKAIKGQRDGRYDEDQVRCQICTIYIHYEGIFCPCCKTRLRRKPRSRKYKERLQKKIDEKLMEKPIVIPNKSFKKEKI
jgi:hypothetical protein